MRFSPQGLWYKRLYKFEPYPACWSSIKQTATKTKQKLKKTTNNNKQKQKQKQKQNQPNRRSNKSRKARATRPSISVFSRFGPTPHIGPYEGRANIISSCCVKNTTDLTRQSGDTFDMFMFTNPGYGNTVGYYYSVKVNAAGITPTALTTPYLDDPSITGSRALKSTALFQNTTPRRFQRPGVYVLTTTQRFQCNSSNPTAAEMLGIRTAIINHRNTRYVSGDKLDEYMNVALSDMDYAYYRAESNITSCAFDITTSPAEVRRPMTVTWIVPAYTRLATPDNDVTPNQEYRIDIFTMSRTRHDMSSILSTTCTPPPSAGQTPASRVAQEARQAIS